MGCCSARDTLENSIEAKIFYRIEKDFGFYKHGCKSISDKFKQFSKHDKITYLEFKQICNALSLDEKNYFDFFSRFTDGELFLVKKLICLGILLGAGEIEDKIKILFENYDNNCSKKLTSEVVKKMLQNIIHITCSIIPSYALSHNMNNDELELYSSNLLLVSNILIKRFSQLILEGRREVSYYDFLDCFERKNEIRLLLFSSKIREYGNDIYTSLSTNGDAALENMPMSPRKSPVERLSRGDQPTKKMKQRKTYIEAPEERRKPRSFSEHEES